MKIYQPPPPVEFVRLQITKRNHDTEYLNLVECSLEEVRNYITDIISRQSVSPFLRDKFVTSVNMRQATGAKNGKSISVSFKGISPKEALELIKSNISENGSKV